jgi:hypothetical protein
MEPHGSRRRRELSKPTVRDKRLDPGQSDQSEVQEKIPPLRGGSERSEGEGSYFSSGIERVFVVEQTGGADDPFRPIAARLTTSPDGKDHMRFF